MEKASLSMAKNNLSRYVERVRRGGRVRIHVRGVAVADLVPVGDGPGDAGDDQALLTDLERRGLVRRGAGGVPAGALKRKAGATGKSLSALLLEERRASR